MRNTNGQNVCLDGNKLNASNGSFIIEPKLLIPLNTADAEFLDFVKFHGIGEFIKSLKMIHDFALYHTDLCFDTKEKIALFNLKMLWEELEVLKKSQQRFNGTD